MWQKPLDAEHAEVSRQPDAGEAPRREPHKRPHLEAVPSRTQTEPAHDEALLAAPAKPLWELQVPAVPTRRLSFFRRRLFVSISEEPIAEARSLQWCLSWVTGVVCASAAIVAVGLQAFAPPALLGVLACQLATVAGVFYLIGDAERRHQPPARTTAVTYGTALAAVAATIEGGIAILAGSLATLAQWTGSSLDPTRGLLLLIVAGFVGLVAFVLGGSWAMAALTRNLRLQPGEKATLLLAATALMAIAFVVLLAW